MGIAYVAKAPDTEEPTTPEGWPPGWEYPPAGGADGPWPPAWPLDDDSDGDDVADYTVSVSCDDEFAYSAPLPFTARILDAGSDTSDLDVHLVEVSATKDGTPVQIKKESGDAFADSVFFLVNNYTGSRYGVDDSVIVDLDASDADAEIELTCEIISVDPTFSGSDTATVSSFTWTVQTAGAVSVWAAIKWSPSLNLLVAISASATNQIMYSSNGEAWTALSAPKAHSWDCIEWSPLLMLYIAGAGGGVSNDRIMTSPDASNWTLRSTTARPQDICWCPDLSLAVAAGNAQLFTSTDAIAWTARTHLGGNNTSVCWAPSLGKFLMVSNSANSSGGYGSFSTDGINWTNAAGVPHQNNACVRWFASIGVFVLISNADHTISTSPDGVTWTDRTPIAGVNWGQPAYSVSRGLLVVVGYAGTSYISEDAGVTWENVSVPESNSFFGLEYAPALDRFCAISVNGTHRVMTGE